MQQRLRSRTPINNEFTVINNTDKEFIVTDNASIYNTGDNIIVENIELIKGKKITNKIESIKFYDEDINSILKEYITKYNNIYITGNIVVDYPEDIELPSFINEYEYIKISGANITLSYCPIKRAIALLDNQFGIGKVTLIIREIIN